MRNIGKRPGSSWLHQDIRGSWLPFEVTMAACNGVVSKYPQYSYQIDDSSIYRTTQPISYLE